MSYRTAKEIAAALGVTKRSVSRRAVIERWRYIVIQDIGGKLPLYICRKLPLDVRNSLSLGHDKQ